MGFIKPTQAATIGSHKITATYYQAYVHDDHDGFLAGAGEWRFGLRSAVQDYTWTGEISVDGARTVDFSDRSRSWYITGNTWFRCGAEEYDGLFWLDWLDYYSYKTVSVSFPGPSVNTWHHGANTIGDVTHYYKYYIENKNPIADSIVNQSILWGTPVSFSGSGFDPEGDSITYHWNFGDNTTSTVQNATHTYENVGTYTVSFRVKDYFGAYSVSRYATVEVLPYVAIDQAFVSNNRSDVDSLQTVDFYAKWAHNDSDVVGGSIYVNETEYVTNATGWITLDVTNNTVGENTWTVTGVNASGVTGYVQLVGNPFIIWDKVNVTLSVENDTLEVGETANITHTAVYEYDGADFDGQIMLNDTLTKMTVGTFYYTTESITNDTYGITAFESNTVAVTFVDTTAPVANAGQDQTVTVDTSASFDASGSTDNVAIVSYEWDFGDETTGTGKTTTHTYTEPGVYNVTLTVKDAEGNSNTDSITVTVEAATTVFPWWILGVVGAVIAAAVVVTLLLWRRKASKGP